MDIAGVPLFAMLKSRLGYLGQRQQVIAENIANSDTPRFTPHDLKAFSYRAGPSGAPADAGTPVATNPMHLSGRRPPSAFRAQEKKDSETTLDGNSVVLEEQMIRMAEARADYDAAISFYQKSMSLLRAAARPPGK